MFAVPNLTTEPLLTINMSILPLNVDSQQVEFIHDYVWGRLGLVYLATLQSLK
jgi:hypothetical protein